MRYENITEGRFLSRPNRFIANVTVNGKKEKVHVKNTGRCRELLTEGAAVYLEKSSNPNRSTAYDLVAVRKGERIVNMDSQAPNRAVHEWLLKKQLFPDLKRVKPESVYKNSRFDFYIEAGEEKIFMEVKGVTLEKGNTAYFPDAPSERAVKHVTELAGAVKEGYGAYILLVIQMKDVACFTPNTQTHPAFKEALAQAAEAGVKILAYDCHVTEESMEIADEVPVALSELDRIAQPLLEWYDKGRRILPWREDPKPYYVWVSEIMLQQTRVEAVKPYFDRFVQNVPDIGSLAGMEEERLIKLWEGLGYYNRARNLRKTAKLLMERYQGELPPEQEELETLPGIGSYTAGAISSIAYGRPVPAVDGNVLRVLSRLRMDGEDILSQKTKNRVERELRPVIPADRPGDFNQALMELGATVCIPGGEPKCKECPWETFCLAHLEGCEQDYPKKKSKKERKIEEKTILVIRDEKRAVFERRPEKGLLAGMYGFPMLEGHAGEEEVLSYLEDIGIKTLRIQEIGGSKHVFSHKEWHMKGYAVRVDELELPYEAAKKAGWLFVDLQEAAVRYPIPSAYNAYTKYLKMR